MKAAGVKERKEFYVFLLMWKYIKDYRIWEQFCTEVEKIKDFFYSISNQDHNHLTSRSDHMGDRALESYLICVNPLEVL